MSKDTQPESSVNGKDYVGALCRVLNHDNECYYVGRIESFDASSDELRITAHRSDHIAKIAQYDAPVKIQIQSSSHITMLYALVKKQAKDFWCVELVRTVQCQDQRDGFRQVIKGTAFVRREGDSDAERIPCSLVDISLTGICFRCKQPFVERDLIVLSDVRLYPKATHSYTFHCMVRRTFTEPGEDEDAPKHPASQETFYGCAFLPLSVEEQDQLYQDIFALQRQERASEL